MTTPYAILEQCLREDLRCLDAHAHLGLFAFRHAGSSHKRIEYALRHYQVEVGVGELTVGKDFAGALPWGWVDNRPFLRCLQGLGLCWWRLSENEKAQEVFARLLLLDPPDALGARFLLWALERGLTWEEYGESEEQAYAEPESTAD
jgi:tetratricopeptide (TPR) repeat protein